MDKFIKMLLIKLSPKYKAVVTTTLFFDAEKRSFVTLINLRMVDKATGKAQNIRVNGKRGLVGELAKWAGGSN